MSPDEMYRAYFKEEEKLDVLQEDYGFITYQLVGPECLVSDVFVKPNKRGHGKSLALLKKVEEIAVAAKCAHLTGYCSFEPGEFDKYTLKIQLMIEAGFKIARILENKIIMFKKIKGEEE